MSTDGSHDDSTILPPKRDAQGILTVNCIDIAVLKSENAFGDVGTFWAAGGTETSQAAHLGINQTEVAKTCQAKVSEGGRAPIDTSMWRK